MPNNIIEIATNNKKLSVYRGFLRVEEGSVQKDIPFNSISAIIITAYNVVYTNNLLQRLCEENIPLVILGKNYSPSGMLLSYIGQCRQTEIQYLQIENKKPLEKRIWQLLVKEKIKNQSKVLDLYKKENKLKHIYQTVLSGDTTNREAYAARLYFKSLFGDDFLRDKNLSGINSFLNYGYAILRAIVARGLVGSGLLPTFGVHHHNRYNAYCLADDIMEPYRPYVDALVVDMTEEMGVIEEMTKEMKARLLSIPVIDVVVGSKRSPLMIAVGQTTASLYKCFSGELRRVLYPER